VQVLSMTRNCPPGWCGFIPLDVPAVTA